MTEPTLKAAGFNPEALLLRAEQVILPESDQQSLPTLNLNGEVLRVGVDLGTAYTVLAVLDEKGTPLAGEFQFTQVVRDGLVVDFLGAVDTLLLMKKRVEARLGRVLTHAASGFPPGVHPAEVRTTANVVQAAGMVCPELIDEPSAANNVLHIKDGAIVDIGGGTTGIAIFKNGKVVYTADEPTGGIHMSLVIAGATNMSLEEAEELKKNPAEQERLFPLICPVMEKMGTIISKHIRGKGVQSITLVGGAPLFPGTADVIREVTGLPTTIPINPLFVTPIGIAMHDQVGVMEGLN